MESLFAALEGARLTLAPIAPWPVAAALAAAAAALFAWGMWRRAPGGGWRLAAALIGAAALLQPALLSEDREALDDVVAVVVDESASQQAADRIDATRAAAAALIDKLKAFDGLEARQIVVDGSGADAGPDGSADGGAPIDETRLVDAVERALADAPRDRIAGAVMITDGRVHDLDPERLAAIGAPVHALVAGAADEGDRVLKVVRAPSFAIVDQPVDLSVLVEDQGAPRPAGAALATAQVTLRVDGALRATRNVTVGVVETLSLDLEHGGENIIELEASPGPKELTLQNNHAALSISGVRDRLRVLLISGEPHPGERAWRNLLKADPAVDLVHFTILRPPEKQDGTPIRELSLIAFPTRELFAVKLDEFDLVIFDRYRRRGVLPDLYLSNVTRYVEHGGAVLTAAGPEFAGVESLYRSGVEPLLPARPASAVVETPFRPRVTAVGARHPVTAELPGANVGDDDAPRWGRWYRLVDSDYSGARALMSGPGARALLVADRYGEGRVAELLSDQGWLWARGHDGGGPQAELLRRLAHWLMKEPDLEEEALTARVDAGALIITRRTLSDETPPPARIETPDGRDVTAPLTPGDAPGVYVARVEASALGLYRVREGDLSALAAAGPLSPREMSEVTATTTPIDDILRPTGGGAIRLSDHPDPAVRRVGSGDDALGEDWIGLRRRGAYRVLEVREVPLAPPYAALIAMAGALLMAWRREGR